MRKEDEPLMERLKMFAVAGQGKDALRGAHGVLVRGEAPKTAFSVGDDITLVFYTHFSPFPINFDRIYREAHVIAIDYYFDVPRDITVLSSGHYVYLALIPLQDLQAGKLEVLVKRLESRKRVRRRDGVFAKRSITGLHHLRFV